MLQSVKSIYIYIYIIYKTVIGTAIVCVCLTKGEPDMGQRPRTVHFNGVVFSISQENAWWLVTIGATSARIEQNGMRQSVLSTVLLSSVGTDFNLLTSIALYSPSLEAVWTPPIKTIVVCPMSCGQGKEWRQLCWLDVHGRHAYHLVIRRRHPIIIVHLLLFPCGYGKLQAM